MNKFKKHLKAFSFATAIIALFVTSTYNFRTNASDGFLGALNTPGAVAIMSFIGMGVNMIAYNAASEQEVDSKNNAEKIQKMIDVYKSTFQDYCPNGRENMNEPRCYCYKDDGAKNSDRSNSQTCQQIWAKDDQFAKGAKANYAIKKDASELYGCMTVNKQFDENCKCKKLVNASGENACLKANQLSISMPGAMANYAKANGFQNVVDMATNTANGNGDLSGLQGSQLLATAEKSKKTALEILKDQLKNNPNNSNLKNLSFINDPKKVEQVANQVFNKNQLASSATPPPYSASETSGKLGDAVKAVEQDLKKNGVELVGGAGKAKTANKKDGFKFNFESNSNSGGQVLNLPETAPEKKYKITGDINTNDSVTIWEVISNRYLQSGLKRLMDE